VKHHCLVVIILKEAASVWRLFHLREAALAAWPYAKAAKVSLGGLPLRCVCVEVCCVELRRT
jgi:hypothetical protein